MTTELDAVTAEIRGHDRFLVAAHENPDGDALGSMLALTLGLRALDKDALMFLVRHRAASGRVQVPGARGGSARPARRPG